MTQEQIVLFSKEGHWSYNVSLHNGEYSWHTYCDGYFNAANVLMGSVIFPDFINEEYRSRIDEDLGSRFFDANKNTFAFPVLYLYRHYIELSIKHLIQKAESINDFTAPVSTFDQHKLTGLFDKLCILYKEVIADESFGISKDKEFTSVVNDFKKIRMAIEVFNKVDPSSMMFRYPVDKENNLNFPNNTITNMLDIANDMQAVHGFFEKIDFLLSELKDFQNEVLSEFYEYEGP